ncbi:MAG: AAA family ATPase [Eubacteriales bacterium]|nr:AAA family ATPase [Eubacteriales bacterium]
MVEGARRIGKSTICEEFGKKEYESYILIDFAKKDKEIEIYFQTYLNFLILFLCYCKLILGKNLQKENHLLFLMRYRCFHRHELL